MITVVDNFLPSSIFSLFVEESQRFSAGLTAGGSRRVFSVGSAAEIKTNLGLKWSIYFSSVAKLFDARVVPETCRLQSIVDERVDWHWDAALPLGAPEAQLETSFTALLYTHSRWEEREDQAGSWESHLGDVVSPLPNRLIIYSRDTKHRVVPGSWDGVRSLALLSFYTMGC